MKEIARIPYPGGESLLFLSEFSEIQSIEAGLVVYDSNTCQFFLDRNPERSLILPPGEPAKNWGSVERILNRALGLSLGRDDVMVGVGGGVVTDLTAFAASIYMRGCRLQLVPTTLLGMVDAAIGGKTGFDFAGAKNLVGSFYAAEEILICPDLLCELPEREFRSGLVEVLKHAFLGPKSLWNLMVRERKSILARDSGTLKRLIPAAAKFKVKVISEDFKEGGTRMILNFGHTFGHALEAATGFSRWSHGEAVAWGMYKALDLGERLGLTEATWAAEARELMEAYGFKPMVPQVPPEAIRAAMESDKKKRDGKLRFVLMEKAGKPLLTEVPETDLDTVLNSPLPPGSVPSS